MEFFQELQGNCNLGSANCSKLQASEYLEGLGQAVFLDKECKEGKSSQSPCSMFIGLRMGRDFCWMFIGQEVSSVFCKPGIYRKLVSQFLSFIFLWAPA